MTRSVAILTFLACSGTSSTLLAQAESAVPAASAVELREASQKKAALKEASQMHLELRKCKHLSAERIKDLLLMELKTLGSAQEEGELSVRIDCFTEVIVIVVELDAALTATRRIENAPQALKERALSLAISELVADLWSERRQSNESVSLGATPALASKTIRDEPATVFLGVNAGFVHFTGPARFAFSGNFSADFRLFSQVEWGLQAAYSTGSWQGEQVSVHEKTLSLVPRIRYRWGQKKFAFLVGGGLPIGWLHWAPEAQTSNVQTADYSAAWLAMTAELALRAYVSSRVFLSGNFSAGGIVVPVRGTGAGEAIIELDGLLLGANLGAGIYF